MPKVFIELHDGLISNIYGSASVDVFIMNPDDKDSVDTSPQRWVTEQLELIEVFEEPSILVAGNLSDGFTFTGPFDSFDKAAEALPRNTDTWVATLEPPEDPQRYDSEPKPPTIPARIVTDDRVMDVTFDAAPWFRTVSDQGIRDLQFHEYGGAEAADRVALASASGNKQLLGLFSYLRDQNRGITDTIGFEVYVDEEAAEKWLLENRPHLMQEEQV